MSSYLSPGVHVKVVPSAVQPIAGVGTSTAGFVGIVPDQWSLPPVEHKKINLGTGDGTKKSFDLPHSSVNNTADSCKVWVDNEEAAVATLAEWKIDLATAPAAGAVITADYRELRTFDAVSVSKVVLCTNFSEFKKSFGDFTADSGQRNLAHAVYGFFDNGGTRCYVTRAADKDKLEDALKRFEPIDEIAVVAAPGIADSYSALATHCAKNKDRFAILDSPKGREPGNTTAPDNNIYGAYYYPWLQVANPIDPKKKLYVPPSGHIAGIYARVDALRGVHKAPANEVIYGALGLEVAVSKSHQAGLNPLGINCIRRINGNIRVWGARTLGGDKNVEWKYINVRRLFLFLRESIDEGTRWTVFEPNVPALWARITRNITAFLTNVWRAGALFGSSPAEAFYVKCDAETNPPEAREQGRLVTEIGVAMVKPAEFVIFRLSQWAGPEA